MACVALTAAGATAGKASYPHLQRLYSLTLHLINGAVGALQHSVMGGRWEQGGRRWCEPLRVHVA
jgi:hypothetical protein